MKLIRNIKRYLRSNSYVPIPIVIPKMEITKNKNPYASSYKFLNSYSRVWFSFWKSKIFGKSLETFGSRIIS
jgi:hypothetical protein